MKLFDKIKDLFMDEIAEEDELELEEEEKPEYKEPPKDVLPKVMRETLKEEEKVELKVKPEEFIKNEKQNDFHSTKEELPKKFNFPIDFETEIPSRNSRNNNANINVLKVEKENTRKVVELYPKKEEPKVKPKFKATPVISPVYGILDKNYTKEEVKERTEESSLMKRPSKKVDFETVRKKAFGNLADEIKDNLICENCELYKEVKKISALKEDDLLYDMTVDDDSEVTIEKAYDNYEEFGVAYEPKQERKNDKSDNILEEEKETSSNDVTINSIINNNNIGDNNDELLKDKIAETTKLENDIALDNSNPETEEKIPSREEKKQDSKVDADFFELIDSMYKERIDE